MSVAHMLGFSKQLEKFKEKQSSPTTSSHTPPAIDHKIVNNAGRGKNIEGTFLLYC